MQSVLQIPIDDARLDDGIPIRGGDLDDLVHLRQAENQAALHRDGAPAEVGAGPSRGNRNFSVGSDRHDLSDFGRCLWKHHCAGKAFGHISIERVRRQGDRVGLEAVGPHHLAQLRQGRSGYHRDAPRVSVTQWIGRGMPGRF